VRRPLHSSSPGPPEGGRVTGERSALRPFAESRLEAQAPISPLEIGLAFSFIKHNIKAVYTQIFTALCIEVAMMAVEGLFETWRMGSTILEELYAIIYDFEYHWLRKYVPFTQSPGIRDHASELSQVF
jgi:hypothetical protein